MMEIEHRVCQTFQGVMKSTYPLKSKQQKLKFILQLISVFYAIDLTNRLFNRLCRKNRVLAERQW